MKKNNVFLLASLFTVFFLANSCEKDESLSPVPQQEQNLRESKDQSLPHIYTNWMSNIDGSLYLSEITIPGTHDSGADKHTSPQPGFLVAPYVICQDFKIYNQLRLGVRWLDIRLFYELCQNSLTLHHSIFNLSKNFDYVLKECIKFLNNHPSETIVLMIKQEYSEASCKDFTKRVYEKIKNHGLDNFYLSEKNPTLDKVRGKICIVRTFHKCDLPHALGMYANWSSNSYNSSRTYNGITWHVQDHYSLNHVSSYTKINEIRSYLYRASKEANSHTFFINFVSGERAWNCEPIWNTAEKIQPPVQKYIMKHMYRRHCGVIILNFAGGGDVSSGGRNCAPSLVKHILMLNDGMQ